MRVRAQVEGRGPGPQPRPAPPTHPKDLAASVFPSRLLVVHDTRAGGEENVAKLTGGQQVVHLLLNVAHGQVKARGHDAALVDAALELHHNLARPVVVHNLKLPNVVVSLHDLEEADDDLGAGGRARAGRGGERGVRGGGRACCKGAPRRAGAGAARVQWQ